MGNIVNMVNAFLVVLVAAGAPILTIMVVSFMLTATWPGHNRIKTTPSYTG